MVEGTSLLRKHTGLNLYRGFESLALRQNLYSACIYKDSSLAMVTKEHAGSFTGRFTGSFVLA